MYKNFPLKIALLENEIGGENLYSILSGKADEVSADVKCKFGELFENLKRISKSKFYNSPDSARVSIANYKEKKRFPKKNTIEKFARFLNLNESDFEDSIGLGDFLLKLRKIDERAIKNFSRGIREGGSKNSDESVFENLFQNSINALTVEEKQYDFDHYYKGIYQAKMEWIRPDGKKDPEKYEIADYIFMLNIYKFLPEQNVILVEKTTRTHFERINGIQENYPENVLTNYEWGWRGIMLTWPSDRSCILLEGKNKKLEQFITIHLIAKNFLERARNEDIHGLYIAKPKGMGCIPQQEPMTSATHIILRKLEKTKEELEISDYLNMKHETVQRYQNTNESIEVQKANNNLDKYGFFSLTGYQ